MNEFFKEQMDYIFFFYGLAFIMLSAVCFILVKGRQQVLPWRWLGLFGLSHGLHEWIDIVYRATGNGPFLQTLRLILIVISFAFLVEFGREGTLRLKGRAPGRWIFAPLAGLAAAGAFFGPSGFDAASRYTLGLVGGIMASHALFLAASGQEGEQGLWLRRGAMAVGLYAVSTGMIVPEASFFPASHLSSSAFLDVTGVPIQFIRGFLAVLASISVWAYSQVPAEQAEAREVRRRNVFWPVFILVSIVAAGWLLAVFLGDIAKDEEMKKGDLLIATMSGQFMREVEAAERSVIERAGSPFIISAVISRSGADLRTAGFILNQCTGDDACSETCFLLDPKGEPFLSCNHDSGEGLKGFFRLTPFFRDSMKGRIGRYFAIEGGARPATYYYASYPVFDGGRRIIGVAAIKKDLSGLSETFGRHAYCFLVDSHGTVILSSRPEMLSKRLWAASGGGQAQAVGAGGGVSLFPREVSSGGYVAHGGKTFLVSRGFVGPDGWSIVILNTTGHITAYRLFSIFTTFVVFSLTVFFFASLYLARESSAQIATSERHYRSLVEGSPNCIMLFDAEGRCLTVNTSGLDLLGRSEEETVGRRLDHFMTCGKDRRSDPSRPEGCPDLGEHFVRVLGGERCFFEAESLGPGGRHIFWRASLNPIADLDGQVRRFVGIFVDITDLKRAEEDLRGYHEHLEELVKERTTELSEANRVLETEITERKLAQDALLDSESRFRTLYNMASDCILLLDPTFKGGSIIVDVNVAACEMHQYSREELIGKPVTFLDDPAGARRSPDIIRRLMDGEALTFEIDHVRRDGSVFPVEVSAQLVQIGGNPYILAIDRDITERKRTERLLLQSKQEWEDTFDTITDMITIHDGEFNIIRANRAAREVLGLPEEGGANLKCYRFYHGKSMPPEGCPSCTCLKSGTPVTFETFDEHLNRFVEIRAIPWFGDTGKMSGLIHVVRDITERKQTEDELQKHREHLLEMVEERTSELKTAVHLLTQEINFRKSAENTLKESEAEYKRLSQEFHALLDAIPDSLMLLSPELEVLWANSGAAVALGRDVSRLTGKHCHELWQKSQGPCANCAALRSFKSGQAEYSKGTTHDGRFWDVSAFPVKDEAGNVKNVIVLTCDITEKTIMQAEAMRAGHLASLGELAAGVAHEINNPINGIINYAQILVNKNSQGTKEHDISCRIIREGDRIAGIVRSLLSFAREKREDRAWVNIQRVLDDTITLMETQIRKDGTALSITMPADLPEVVANPQQLQQVFLNLISNARYALNEKYPAAHEDKILSVSGECVSSEDAPCVRVTFHDHGVGIPAEVMDKVINPFFSTKPSGQGTGLGLSISHGIIKDHDGRLMIESVSGKFTKVIVDLPMKEKR